MPASVEHIPTLRRLRDRLSDLSMRNRSIRLIQLPKKRAFDLAWLDAVHPGDSAGVLERVLNGRKQAAGLLAVGTDDDGAQALHKGLAYLEREVRFVEEERGAYDLSVGVLFVCGAAAEGKYIQAPLFLVPRRLMLDRRSRGGTRWTLEPMDDPKEVNVNRTLLLALSQDPFVGCSHGKHQTWSTSMRCLFGTEGGHCQTNRWSSRAKKRITQELNKIQPGKPRRATTQFRSSNARFDTVTGRTRSAYMKSSMTD